MPQDNPPLLDKTMNTTEQTPRNLADVLASGLASIANNVKPDGSDISINVPGMSANNVDDGFSELKQSLDNLDNMLNDTKIYTFFNVNTFTITLQNSPSTSHSAAVLIFSPNQKVLALSNIGTKPNITNIYAGASSQLAVSLSGKNFTVTTTDSGTLWGQTVVIVSEH